MSIKRLRFIFIALVAMCLCSVALGCDHQGQEQHIVVLGDSNIWLAGDSCNNPKGWMTWLNSAMAPASCRSYARSGASWSNTPATTTNPEENIAVLGDNNVIYNQVVRLTQASAAGEQPTPTLILVAAGGNDAWFADKREHEFDLTVDDAFAMSDAELLAQSPDMVLSLAGAIRHNTLLLRQAFPNARIVFLTSTPMTKVEPQMMARVADITELTGQRLGVPTVRLDLDGPIHRDEELNAHVNTYDGVHTNEAGAQKVGRYVADRLTELLKQ